MARDYSQLRAGLENGGDKGEIVTEAEDTAGAKRAVCGKNDTG